MIVVTELHGSFSFRWNTFPYASGMYASFNLPSVIILLSPHWDGSQEALSTMS